MRKKFLLTMLTVFCVWSLAACSGAADTAPVETEAAEDHEAETAVVETSEVEPIETQEIDMDAGGAEEESEAEVKQAPSVQTINDMLDDINNVYSEVHNTMGNSHHYTHLQRDNYFLTLEERKAVYQPVIDRFLEYKDIFSEWREEIVSVADKQIQGFGNLCEKYMYETLNQSYLAINKMEQASRIWEEWCERGTEKIIKEGDGYWHKTEPINLLTLLDIGEGKAYETLQGYDDYGRIMYDVISVPDNSVNIEKEDFYASEETDRGVRFYVTCLLYHYDEHNQIDYAEDLGVYTYRARLLHAGYGYDEMGRIVKVESQNGDGRTSTEEYSYIESGKVHVRHVAESGYEKEADYEISAYGGMGDEIE